MEVKITLEIKDQKIEMNLEEARKLYEDLSGLFEKSRMPYYPLGARGIKVDPAPLFHGSPYIDIVTCESKDSTSYPNSACLNH